MGGGESHIPLDFILLDAEADGGDAPPTSQAEPPVPHEMQNHTNPGEMMTDEELLAKCPWLHSVPLRLRERLIWSARAPDLGAQKSILLLYAGPDDDSSLDNMLIAQHPEMADKVVAFDILRTQSPDPQDIMDDNFYSSLCVHACGPGWTMVGGGPNCRTWSILRWFPKPGAPTPVRARPEHLVWGLDTNTLEEQMDTDRDSLLLLRQMVITALASDNPTRGRSHSFLEHPQDPKECSKSPSASRCSTIWATEVYKDWAQRVQHQKISFDQCMLGQVVQKCTTLSTTLPLHHWHGLECDHGSHKRPPSMSSSDLSRYPAHMMMGLVEAIAESLPGPQLSLNNLGDEISHPTPEPPGRTDRASSVPLSQSMTTTDDPVLVQSGFKVRPLRDGGGKPSLGRRPPHLRPRSNLADLGDQIRTAAAAFTSKVQASIHQGERMHPFTSEELRSVRDLIGSTLGMTRQQSENITEGQPFHLDLIHSLAKALGDIDYEYPKDIKPGVPLGVTSPTWTSPGVWPSKDELKGESSEWDDIAHPEGRDNYPSARDFAPQVRQTFVEEVTLGMVEGPFTKAEAAQRCGCMEDELCPGPLAAIDEGDKIRTIYDGSWGRANAHIQQNTTEKTTAPTVMDCVQAIHWLRTVQRVPLAPVALGTERQWCPPGPETTWSILKADVTKAHRRIKITPEGWKFQVAHLEGEWWINKVGTYGMASAQLYWGRMAALLLRICYLLFPSIDWGFVFVDDFCWILRTQSATLDSCTLLLFLLAIGCPLSWHKTVLSEINTWLGFQINPRGPVIDFPSDKKSVLHSLLQSLQEGNPFTAKDIERALGRLNWATSAWPLSRPFLQPFWAWKMATTTTGRPGQIIRSFAQLLLYLLNHPQVQPCPYDPVSDWWGASDASADPTGKAIIGGWIANVENPSKSQTWWFHFVVPLSDHPWAHKNGDPTKRIAALEMFGTLILTFFLLMKGGKSLLRTRLALISDNQGNIFALLNQKTKKMPTSAFLMQLIVMLHRAGVQIAPSHVKRDFNQWADELTHETFKDFPLDRQLPIQEAISRFDLLWSLLGVPISRPPLKRKKIFQAT